MQVDWNALISAVVAFIAGFGAGFSVKVHLDRSRKTVINQKGNTAGGDIVAGNIDKR